MRTHPCPTCGGAGWIDDPAHPIGGSYEDRLAAGPTPWIDCPDCSAHRAPPPASTTIGASAGMYVSEPILGRQSAFYAGDRYIADAELARRERQDQDELAALEVRLTAAGEAAERLYRHRYALTPAGRALVATMREEVGITRAAARRQAVAL